MNRPREPPQEEIRMKLTDKENYEFMANKERVAADKEMRERKKEVERIAGLSIETIIVTMPQAVKNLQNAYEKLNIVEAKVENEIIQKKRIRAETGSSRPSVWDDRPRIDKVGQNRRSDGWKSDVYCQPRQQSY